MSQFDSRTHDVNELKNHINKPVKLTTLDGKAFEGILGHVDEQNIYIVVPIIIGSNQVGDIGGHHVGDIDGRTNSYPGGSHVTYGFPNGRSYPSYSVRAFNGQLILPLASLSDVSFEEAE